MLHYQWCTEHLGLLLNHHPLCAPPMNLAAQGRSTWYCHVKTQIGDKVVDRDYPTVEEGVAATLAEIKKRAAVTAAQPGMVGCVCVVWSYIH